MHFVYIVYFRFVDRRVDSVPSENFQEIGFEDFELQQAGFEGSVLDAYCTHFLYLSIGLHASMFIGIVGNPMCHTFHVLSLLAGIV
jgi:hypothetical protein